MSMKDRQDAFENKFAHDAALKFKAEAKRNNMLGLWAAEHLGKSGDEAEIYAKSVMMADLEEAGDEDVFRKVRGDLPETVSDADIREQMVALMGKAIDEIENS